MRKLLLIMIVFVTSLSYCQTAEEYYNRGISKAKLQDYQGAIADYFKAIELNPNYSEAYANRGISKFKLRDYRGSIVDYSKAIQLNPNYSEAYFYRGLSKYFL
jgi:tetratricopeptide (TPR) repeat protein